MSARWQRKDQVGKPEWPQRYSRPSVNLKQKALSAGRWTAVSAMLRSALHLLQMMILARLLVPADFGLMAVAGALLAAINLFSDLGLSRALVHFPMPSRKVLSSLYWLNLATGVLLMLLLAAAAPGISALYNEPALIPLLLIISLMFPLSAFGQQFRAIAEKELRFAALARIEIPSSLAGFAAAVFVAWSGGGANAFATGIVVTAASSSLLACLRLRGHYGPSCHARLSETLPYVRFGGYLIGENFATTVRTQADVFVGGLILGPSAMGVYALPRDVCLRIAHTVINPVVTRVGFPVMAHVQHDRASLKSIYLQILRITASFNFPVYVALGVFAPEAVALLFGSQWEGAVLYLRIFAAWGLIRSVGNPIGSLLHAAGRVRLAMGWSLFLLLLLPPLFWLGAKTYGLEGLAWIMLAIQALLFLPVWRFLVYPLCGVRFAEYIGQIIPALVAALVAGGLALMASSFATNILYRLALGLITHSAAYLALSLWLNKSWIATVLEMLRLKPVRWSA